MVNFSIITVCYNADQTIAKTIESVLNQKYAPYEYYIIDGESQDQTIEIAKSYEDAFVSEGIKYRVISEKDKGMYDALNKGTKMARGELIGQINSDDWYEPTALQEMAHLYQETKFDMAYADLRMIQPDGHTWIKTAKVDAFVNSRHWNHPTQFTKRTVLLKKPYACRCMSDDLDVMLWIRKHQYKVVALNKVLSNFTMQGMSHCKDLHGVFDRVKTKTVIYTQNGYSWLHGVDVAVVECGKWILGR